MSFGQPSDYGNIENRRGEHAKILKWKTRLVYFVALVFSLLFVSSVFNNTNDLLSYSQFFVNWSDIYSTEQFNTPLYLAIGGGVLTVISILFFFPSKKGLERALEIKQKRSGFKPSIFFKIKYKIICWLDILFFWMLFPVSYLIFNIGEYSRKNADKFYFRAGWLEHIEQSFFKETAIKVDGYERAKELDILQNYKEYFSREKGDSVNLCPVYHTVYQIFRDKKSFEDLILITEGYLDLKEEKKYDTLLSEREYYSLLKSQFNNDIHQFRCYNGIDNIYFSHTLIKDLIDKEAKHFSSYMSNYATRSRQNFTRSYLKNFRLIKKDKKLLGKIASFPLPVPVDIEDIKNNDEMLTERIVELCEAYFRIVAFKHIVGQYMNLPAGTMVVKMEDYTARMIVEIYDEETLIQIVSGKNDGQSKDFQSDALVNIFLAAYNYFNISTKYSFLDKVHDIFNLRDFAISAEETAKINNQIISADFIKDGYREPTKEELSFIQENISDKYTA